jgi:hypothetical protein
LACAEASVPGGSVCSYETTTALARAAAAR